MASSDGLTRELLRRIAAPYYSQAMAAPEETEIVIGELPAIEGIVLPAAPEARVVGATVRRRGGRPSALVAYLDLPGGIEDAKRFYEQALGELGWQAREPTFGGGSFVSGPSAGGALTYCKGKDENDPYYSVSVGPIRDRTSEVRLSWNAALDGFSPCCEPRGGLPWMAEMPTLAAPAGVQVQQRGGWGGGGGTWSAGAVAFTDLSAKDLERSYAEQLRAAGWTEVASDASRLSATSEWLVPGKGDGPVILTVVAASGQPMRAIFIQKERAGTSGGWSTSGGSTVRIR